MKVPPVSGHVFVAGNDVLNEKKDQTTIVTDSGGYICRDEEKEKLKDGNVTAHI